MFNFEDDKMIEMIIRPKRAQRHPWEMFFVGLFYASISFLLVSFVFRKDFVLREGSGLLLVIFTVICCLPFVYFIIKLEEGKDIQIDDSGKLIKEHWKALVALMWLFLGFVVAFSFWHILMPEQSGQNFNFQIKTFCAINSPSNYDACISNYGVPSLTGSATGMNTFLSIFSNNIYVLIFTILFSLVFGAGAIFILVWNASVIASAIGIFSKGNLISLPAGLLRYMIHGLPEISAYFVGALAGGIVSVAVIRKDLRGEGTWKILQDALILVILAIIILIVAGLMEVYLTPLLF
jgi:uncharacterized membrane protein SpoIIM required for sporulation